MTKIKLTPKIPQNTDVTLTITMTLEEWKKFKEQLSDNWPSWQFSIALRKALESMETYFETEIETGD